MRTVLFGLVVFFNCFSLAAQEHIPSDSTDLDNHGEEVEIDYHVEKHNRYELEISLNQDLHAEFTASVYFMPEAKVQVTADQTFHHFAGVVVREIPLGKSDWSTFAGMGGTYGFEKHEDHESHHESVSHHWSVIAQTGLAYAFNRHWSTGFTLSPGWSFQEDKFDGGFTLDLVYGF